MPHSIRIGVLQESAVGEKRVAIVPETVRKLSPKGVSFVIQAGAGAAATFSDEEYRAAGATIAASPGETLSACDAVIKVARATERGIQARHRWLCR